MGAEVLQIQENYNVKRQKAKHLYSAISGSCSYSSAVRPRLGRTCSL